MSTLTSLFASINGAKLANANGTSASNFASGNSFSKPFDPSTYRPSVHVVTPNPNPIDFPAPYQKQVTVFAIFNEPATDTLHSTTDIHEHNLAKLKLRSNGYMFHTSHASAFLKLQARRANEAVRQKICAAKAAE